MKYDLDNKNGSLSALFKEYIEWNNKQQHLHPTSNGGDNITAEAVGSKVKSCL